MLVHPWSPQIWVWHRVWSEYVGMGNVEVNKLTFLERTKENFQWEGKSETWSKHRLVTHFQVQNSGFHMLLGEFAKHFSSTEKCMSGYINSFISWFSFIIPSDSYHISYYCSRNCSPWTGWKNSQDVQVGLNRRWERVKNRLREERGGGRNFPRACWPKGALGLPLPSLHTALSWPCSQFGSLVALCSQEAAVFHGKPCMPTPSSLLSLS